MNVLKMGSSLLSALDSNAAEQLKVGKKIKRATGVCTFRAQAAFKAI